MGFGTTEGISWAVDKAQRQRERSKNWMAVGSLGPGAQVFVTLVNLLMGNSYLVKIYDIGGGIGNFYFSVKP